MFFAGCLWSMFGEVFISEKVRAQIKRKFLLKPFPVISMYSCKIIFYESTNNAAEMVVTTRSGSDET